MLIDSHAHLGSLENTDQAVQNALDNNVSCILNMSSDLPSAHEAVEFINKYHGVYGAVGIHPHAAKTYTPQIFSEISGLTSTEKIVAVGETGLDYYYDFSPREIQKESLQKHIDLSIKTGLPVVLHVRDCEDDMKAILKQNACDNLKGVIHCFTGDYESALLYIELGFYISFSGILTFKRSEDLREVAKKLPLDKLLVETDSPYLAPVPYRGKKNEPAYVKHVAKTLASVREKSFEEICEITTSNCKELFNIT
ncbi:MAG: TatD family hydrolase [Candidatus Dadabacteria bacterium]|nr:TatD family hydrolase [Candidatus Dadabacteria bacterium]NIS08000.1 TatD family hydrolase [Candidatus Dadabacteria bacterium]NIY21579.1 YchF/TatD family DNA exonuclease [Candidatus Dadabacteria bacterium]